MSTKEQDKGQLGEQESTLSTPSMLPTMDKSLLVAAAIAIATSKS
jgi:hypothetical protein